MKGFDVFKVYFGYGFVDWEVFIRFIGNVLFFRNSSSWEDCIIVVDIGVIISNDSSFCGFNDIFKVYDSWVMCIGFEFLIVLNDEYFFDKEVDFLCKGFVEDKCLEWFEEFVLEGDFCLKLMYDSEFWENIFC